MLRTRIWIGLGEVTRRRWHKQLVTSPLSLVRAESLDPSVQQILGVLSFLE